MSVSDSDIELLEAHLDGELSSTVDAALRARLSTDHELVTELIALRADRAVRVEVFESFEPDDLAVANMVRGVRKQITKDAVWGDRVRILRYIASAAAVVVISFSAGWLGKGNTALQNQSNRPMQTVAQRDEAGSINFAGNQNVGPEAGAGLGTLVSNMHLPQSDPRPPERPPERHPAGFQVNLTDSFGNFLASQHFDTLEEAHQFQQDLAQWQRQQQQQNRIAEPVDYKEQF
jgi:hypothetical protein